MKDIQMIKFKEYIIEAHDLSTKEGVHMKTFNDFISEDKETFDYLIKKLNKTAKSIGGHKSYGGHANTDRGFDLSTRYDSILQKIRDKHRPEWWAYCDRRGWAHNHDGRDIYA